MHNFHLTLIKIILSFLLIIGSILPYSVLAKDKSTEPPLLVIGASFANGITPFFNDFEAPLGGIATNFGSYLSLGSALIRERRLSGHVINEGQAGATTFARKQCFPGPECIGPGWDSYDTQFKKALARVTSSTGINADYLLIVRGNDCNHPDAFGIPLDQTSECTFEQMNASVDLLIDVGKQALAKGITPIYGIVPAYERLDLEKIRSRYNWPWIVSEQSHNIYRDLYRSRVENEMPDALLVNYWQGFQHMGDGLHPDRRTVIRAAKRIARAIKHHQQY